MTQIITLDKPNIQKDELGLVFVDSSKGNEPIRICGANGILPTVAQSRGDTEQIAFDQNFAEEKGVPLFEVDELRSCGFYITSDTTVTVFGLSGTFDDVGSVRARAENFIRLEEDEEEALTGKAYVSNIGAFLLPDDRVLVTGSGKHLQPAKYGLK